MANPAARSPPIGVEQMGWSHREWSKDKLVGNIPVTAVRIGGVSVTSLLDSGRELSLVSETVYHRDFESRGVVLHSPEDLVLKAANGGSVPYWATCWWMLRFLDIKWNSSGS
ncbi:hypothetical protein Hamer_G007110 [Homarus americanus]|uniref:Uncharacterized protein n=1 Tax=Homarus americanus TaxID=6706 RepID=A0A8J5JW51_HOMAM|nr:hypothetical protein Hamer_G007110 [Homarus americanus]